MATQRATAPPPACDRGEFGNPSSNALPSGHAACVVPSVPSEVCSDLQDATSAAAATTLINMLHSAHDKGESVAPPLRVGCSLEAASDIDAALFDAASAGDAAVCATLLQGGARVVSLTVRDRNPLVTAAAAGHARTVQLLVHEVAHIFMDIVDAVFRAAYMHGHAAVCSVLLALQLEHPRMVQWEFTMTRSSRPFAWRQRVGTR